MLASYSPQKCQGGSAFALTYRLLLRSCKLMGAFLISPLPPVLLEPLQTAGPLRSTDVTPLPRYHRPSRIPLAVHRLPGASSADFSTGRGGFLQLLSMTLSPCCPYQPRRSVSSLQSLATLHAAFARQVRARPSGCSTFEAIWVHLRYSPVARSPSFFDGFVNRLQDFQFPSFLLFKLRGLDFYPGGADSH